MKSKLILLVHFGFILCIVMITIGISSADSVKVELASHLGGQISQIAIEENYAYIGQGQDLVVLNITDISNPSEVGRLNTPALISDVAVSGNYAYVIDSTNYNSDLLIVDISNPTSPTIAGSYDSAGNPQLVTVAGNYAYVTSLYGLSYGHETHLEIVDISNPLAPTLIGTYTSINIYDYPQDIVVSGNYAYVANLYGGLEIVNISNHLSPTYVGSYDTPTYAMSVAVADNYAYVGDRNNGLVIIDITDPAVPSLLSIYAGSAYDIDISGNYAYVSDGGGLVIVDISDSSNPSYVERYDTPGDASDVAVDGDYAYVADNDNGLVIVDISNPASPIIASSYATTWLSTGVTISGNYAYVADGQRGLVIVNITNPYTPKIVGSCYISVYGYGATSVAVAGNYAYVTDWANRLVTVDVSNPSSPIIVDTCDTYGSPSDIAILGNYAYLACVSNGLVIMDISNSSNPSYVTNCDTAGDPQDVTVAGNYAYVADGSNGLVIVNITNPYTPKIEGSYDTEGNAMGVAIAGDFAYIADGSYTVSHAIVDISNPSSPTRVGSYYTGVASDVTISGNYAYIAANNDGLAIVDITNLSSSPIKCSLAGSLTDVAISGDYAYVSSWCDGLSILHVDTPDTSVSGANMYISNNAATSMENGNTLTYTLYYLNFGNTFAEDVVLEDTLPLEMEFVSASDGGIYDPGTRKITWNIGSVDAYPSGKGFRTVTVRVPEGVLGGTVIQNTASISTTTPETTYADNNANAQTLVTGLALPPGVSIEPVRGAVGIPSVNWMDSITFTYQTNNSAVRGVNITIHLDDGMPDIIGSMKGTQTGTTTTWTHTDVLYPRHGAATVTYTEQFDPYPYTPSYDIRGDNGDFVTADDIYSYIKVMYPQSPMLNEPNIGSRFISAAKTYGIDPVFLVSLAEMGSQFGTVGWGANHPEAHNAFMYGVYDYSTTVDQINCASSWGDMVNRVACAIATGPNYFSKGRYTIEEIYLASDSVHSTQTLSTISSSQAALDDLNENIYDSLTSSPSPIEAALDGLIGINYVHVIPAAANVCLVVESVPVGVAVSFTAMDYTINGLIPKTPYTTWIEETVNHYVDPSWVARCATQAAFSIYIDPAGYIYDVDTGERIPEATVWLQRPDGNGGWENVPTGENPPVSQPDTNPLITNNAGQYQWDVLEGTYRVHVEADGYYSADSVLVNIPPPVTDLHVGLTKIPSANPPVASINGPYTVDEGSQITFDASGSIDLDGDVLHFRWDFNNDGIWDTFWQSTPAATYTWYDDYSGTSKVEVSDGTTIDDAIASVTINNVAPTVNIGDDKTAYEGETVIFGSVITDPGSFDVQNYAWDFGDGSTVSHIPIHAYEIEGVYTVTLTVTDDDGGVGTDTLIVTVNNVASNDTPPVPSIDIEKYVWNGVGWEDADTAPGPSLSSGPVKFQIIVTNTGNVPLIGVNVTDDKYGQVTLSNTTLFAGAAIEAEYNMSWASGQQVNTAEVEGYYDTTKHTDNDNAHYYGLASSTAIYDNGLRQTSPTKVYSTTTYIDVGKGASTSRDVMLFDLSMYNKTDIISKATLSLYWYYPSGNTRTSDTVVEIYRPVGWDPKYVSWKNRAYNAPWSVAGGDWFDKTGIAHGGIPYASVTFPGSKAPDKQYHEFDVTDLVQAYINGTYENTGFFIKAQTESGNNYIAFYSSEWSIADQKPKLTVYSNEVSESDTPTDKAPIADAGADKTTTTGSIVYFDGSSSTDDNGIMSYLWDFDVSDGVASDATGVKVNHTYAKTGNYTVTLNVTDTSGNSNLDTVKISVSDAVPPVGNSVSHEAVADNRLRQTKPSTVYATTTYIDVGKGTSTSRDVMLFNLSMYNKTDIISKATLSLYWYYPPGNTRTSDTVVEIYRPMEWSPKYVSWKYRVAGTPWIAAGGDWFDKTGLAQGDTPYASATFSSSALPDKQYHEFDVTELVQAYIRGDYDNTGFFIKAKTESGNNYIAFSSSDWSNAEQRPKLTITC